MTMFFQPQLGKLVIKPFTHQTECPLSGPNMCKGKILDDYISSRKQEGVNFSSIFYAGKDISLECMRNSSPPIET